MRHGYEMYSVGNIGNNYVKSLVTDGNQIYCGDHFEMYRNIESLCGIPGANIVLQVNYTSKTNKQTHRKRDQICGYQRWGGGGIGGRSLKVTNLQLYDK